MVQVAKEWQVVREAEELVATLCQKYPEKLGMVKADKVGVAQVTNKERPESDDSFAKIIGVTDPANVFCSKMYIIWFFKSTWDELNPAQKSALIMSKLLRISDDCDGGLLAEDLKDIKSMVKNFGVDYMVNPKLPDLAKEKVEF